VNTSDRTRTAFAEAVTAYLRTVRSVGPDQWDLPAMGEWTVRELVAHASRALITTESYLDVPARTIEVATSAGYFAAALDLPGVHADVAERGRAQVAELGPDPVATLDVLAERVLARVADTPDDAVLGTFIGGIRFVDYLPSRVVELVVHTLDLNDALDRAPDLPRTAVVVALETLAEVAAARPGVVDPAALVRALTGRAPLPGDFNVLG